MIICSAIGSLVKSEALANELFLGLGVLEHWIIKHENQSICNLDMKDSLIYFERFIQLSLSLPLGSLVIDLEGENMFFLSWFIEAKICFFLNPLT